MRQQHEVPERRTERFSPTFRPGGRFCDLGFRYQSSPIGIEGEISRPLDYIYIFFFCKNTFIEDHNRNVTKENS